MSRAWIKGPYRLSHLYRRYRLLGNSPVRPPPDLARGLLVFSFQLKDREIDFRQLLQRSRLCSSHLLP